MVEMFSSVGEIEADVVDYAMRCHLVGQGQEVFHEAIGVGGQKSEHR